MRKDGAIRYWHEKGRVSTNFAGMPSQTLFLRGNQPQALTPYNTNYNKLQI